MSSMAPEARGSTRASALATPRRLRELVEAFPAWPCVALSVVSWVVLVRLADGASSIAASWHHGGAVTGPRFALEWVIMTNAMMVPLVLGPAHAAAERSIWARRGRAVGGFLTGYLAAWALAAIPISLACLVVAWITPAHLRPACGFVLAALWQLAPARRRAHVACHRTMPLAPRGWRAERDCVRYGATVGAHCVGSCWALMAACQLAGHGTAVLAIAAGIGLVDRYAQRHAQRFEPRRTCVALLLIAAASALDARL